jgi:hypothetical protein
MCYHGRYVQQVDTLAKVGVESSNLFARSIKSLENLNIYLPPPAEAFAACPKHPGQSF